VTLQFHSSSPPTSRHTGSELGGSLVGQAVSAAASGWPIQAICAPLLGTETAAVQETWRLASPCVHGASEGITWRRAGDVLFGVIDLDEAEFAAMADRPPLQAASEEAYHRIFRLLDTQKLPHLWRIWNYMSDINAETHGLERYRQFNIGRQNAFIAPHRSATGNMPAACALGLASGPLSIAFLAGAMPAVPIENPRQVSACDYPAEYGPRAPIFSRAALVHPPGQEILFISGTASIVGYRTIHPDDVAGQCREALGNIAAVVAEANRAARSRPFALDELVCRVYVRRAADFPMIRDTLASSVGGADVLYVQADICRADLLLEIEAMASHALGQD
jgi:enamine deaminase RidA (YjgF/YER057c/UK114 family)